MPVRVRTSYLGVDGWINLPSQKNRSQENGAESEKAAKEMFNLSKRRGPKNSCDAWDSAVELHSEIKSCTVQSKAGNSWRPGKFRIWKDAHEWLMEQNAYYVFVVHQFDVEWQYIDMIRMRAVDVDELDLNWIASPHETKDETIRKGRRRKVQAFIPYPVVWGYRLDRLPIPDDANPDIVFGKLRFSPSRQYRKPDLTNFFPIK